MPFYQALATLANQSGATEDVRVTSFYVEAPTQPNSLQLADWGDAIETYFQDNTTDGCMRGCAGTGHTIKYYAADGSVPNYPFDEQSFTLSPAPSALDMPVEVSLCVSYANDTANSVARARRRGRIYMSGWQTGFNAAGRPTGATVSAMAANFKTYVDAVNVITDFTAVVYSRTNVTGYAIERIWVDNEWDTMRSRGLRATTRTTVTPA